MRRPAGAWPEGEERLLGGRGDLEVLLEEAHSQDRAEGHRDRENRGDTAGPDMIWLVYSIHKWRTDKST